MHLAYINENGSVGQIIVAIYISIWWSSKSCNLDTGFTISEEDNYWSEIEQWQRMYVSNL